jgi:hypothetical protein
MWGKVNESTVRAVIIQKDSKRKNISSFLYSKSNDITLYDDSHLFQIRPIRVTAGRAVFAAIPFYLESASTPFSSRCGS